MAPELGGERGGYADVAELAAAARAFDAVEGEDTRSGPPNPAVSGPPRILRVASSSNARL